MVTINQIITYNTCLPRKILGKQSGVYLITNVKNGKSYVGSTKNIYDRFYTHITNLIKKTHVNNKLNNAVTFYGIENFSFEIIKAINIKDFENENEFYKCLLKHEQFFLDTLQLVDFGYNINRKAESCFGNIPWNKGKKIINIRKSGVPKGNIPANKGSKQTIDQITRNKKQLIGVIQLDLNGNEINRFPGISIAERETKIPRHVISYFLNNQESKLKVRCDGNRKQNNYRYKWKLQENNI